MSRETGPATPVSAPSAAAPRASQAPAPNIRAAVTLSVLVGLGLAGWLGFRIYETMQTRAHLASQRANDAAETAALAGAPISVHAVSGRKKTWQPVVPLDGTVQARQQAALGFKVPGRLAAIFVKVGDVVKEGAPLGSLDPKEMVAQLAAAQAQVRAAEAQLNLATDSATRTQGLLKDGAVAQAEGFASGEQQRLAAAQLDATRAQVDLLRVNIANHTLLAPFAGTVTTVPDGKGAILNPGQPVFEVIDASRFRLRGTVGVQDAALLHVGSKVRLATEGGSAIEGTLQSISNALDPGTRRVPVEALIDVAAAGTLRSGQFVRATVDGGAPLEVIEFPREVLRPGSQDEVVVLKGDHVELRPVVFATAPDGALLVRSGLAVEEQLVLSPTPEMQSGDKVAVLKEGQKP